MTEGILDALFSKGIPAGLYQARSRDNAEKETQTSVEELLHQKGRLLQTKLEVLAAEMIERWRLRASNLEVVARDYETASVMLQRLSVQANYGLRQHQDKRVFYELLFGLQKQKREEEVECWRDIVQVMRDFLGVWEAHELAKARAVFLTHAGP